MNSRERRMFGYACDAGCEELLVVEAISQRAADKEATRHRWHVRIGRVLCPFHGYEANGVRNPRRW